MPYFTNDNWAYYDLNAHRYVLKPEFVRDNYSIELINALDLTGSINSQAAVSNLLKRASRTIYQYIYSHHPGNVEFTTYRLAKNSALRTTILEAMGELIYSWLVNNSDLTIQNGVSIDTGKLFEKIDAMRNQVPISVEQMLYSADITTRAQWPYDEDYEDDKLTKGINW